MGEPARAQTEESREGEMIADHETAPSPGPSVEVDDLTEIMGESAPAPATPPPPRSAYEQKIREALKAAELDLGEGTGWERRLASIPRRRAISLDGFLTMIAAVGEKRRAQRFDADGERTFWDVPDAARAYVYRALCNNRPPAPVVLGSDGLEVLRRPPSLYEVATRGQGAGMEPKPQGPVDQILTALGGTYHGHQPLLSLANPKFASRFAQHAKESACGGRFDLADLVAVIRYVATVMAFKLKRDELLPLSGLDSWLTRALREQRPGCAAALNAKTDKARFYAPRDRPASFQPGPAVTTRAKEITTEEALVLADDLFGPKGTT